MKKKRKSKKLPWTSDVREIERRMINAGLIGRSTLWPEDLRELTNQPNDSGK